MYAIVRISGKQYHAEIGNTIVVEKLPYEAGHKLTFEEVLLISDGENTRVGQPFVTGASVDTEIVEQFKGKKIVVFKYKPKVRYRRKQGHRQNYTRLLVNHISTSGSKTRAARKAEVVEEIVAGSVEIEPIAEPVVKKTRATKKASESEAKSATPKTRSTKKVGDGEEKPAAKKTRSTKTVSDSEEKPAAKKTRSTKKTKTSEEA
ncbi:MAG: 50S ribosomal protein L21 [Anaerolineae bacterium]|nr:50S ribosomal protein L21 [Anaerolineae bacterium]